MHVADPGTVVRLLGPLEIAGPGGVSVLSSARQRALLAVLALRPGEVLSRAQLIDALWGSAPPPTAVKTLHSHIARVRGALSGIGLGDVLVTREPGYELRLPPECFDVARFEEHLRASRRHRRAGNAGGAVTELRAGLALWRGDPLADCPVAEWGQAEIVRLHDARAAAEEELAEADLMRGEHAAVAQTLERLLVRYPLRERLWELLVIAHHRGGRRDEALRAYRRARGVLVSELGVEPGPRLRQLEAEVLAGAAEPEPVTGPAPAAPAQPLPEDLTSLVGRQRELADVHRLLTQARLVTLTGPGGCGKTRLAVSAIGAVAERGRPVAMVDLTPVRVAELVCDAVAATLGVVERPGADPADTLAETLAGGDLLLVLDNCEHLVAACAELAGRLLTACPGLTVLATSREALRVPGETCYEVPPLAVPDPGVPRTLSELAVYDAVQLFLARAADHGAQPYGDEDAAAIAQLCAALDGLPLAIELAAARSPVLTPEQIGCRLRNRFGLLTVGSRTAPSHHRALRATMAWSHDQLTPDEAALFARLAVFAGGFSVEAAEAVWRPERALDALTGLVTKSLVRARRHGSSSRFSLLETIAAYAAERLREDPSAEELAHRRHAEFYLQLAEDANAEPTGTRLTELRAEHDNLRAAMGWLATQPDTAGELRLAAALSRYCHLHGHYREGRHWLDRALARTGDAAVERPVLVHALAGAASLALLECDYAQAAQQATEGLELCEALGDDHQQFGRLRRLLGSVARERAQYAEALRTYAAAERSFRAGGDPFGVAYARQLAGATAWLAGNLDAAEDMLTASLTRLRDLGDRKGAASSLAYLGAVALYRGEPEQARRLLDEALDVFGELEFKEGVAWTLNLLGLLEQRTAKPDRAAQLLQASLALHRELGDRWREASVLEALAGVACATEEPDRAVWLLHRAERIRAAIGAPVPAIERPALAGTYQEAVKCGPL